MTIPQRDPASNGKGKRRTPPLPRVRLDTLGRVRREMARLYLQGREGQRDVQDASRLANILALIGRLIEGAELEKRLEKLEQASSGRTGDDGRPTGP